MMGDIGANVSRVLGRCGIGSVICRLPLRVWVASCSGEDVGAVAAVHKWIRFSKQEKGIEFVLLPRPAPECLETLEGYSVSPSSHTITCTNQEERREPYRAPPPTQESKGAAAKFVLVVW